MARLILTINNEVISSHKVPPSEQLSIGRHSDNHICIDNLSVSGHHAAVRMVDQKLILNDLKSRNGTFLNQEPVTESQLAHQDWITIGKHIFIVDLYDSLSLEATENELKARSSANSHESEQTMILEHEAVKPDWGFDYLSFLSGDREDYELTEQVVSIGKNKDADIKVGGFWSMLAGEPSATITRRQDDYFLEHVEGMLKPKINGTVLQGTRKLNHQDIIKIGPVQMQIRCVRRPSK
jgi:pSer/pThr/pTyr-binding forkhead associated (FHA) protein